MGFHCSRYSLTVEVTLVFPGFPAPAPHCTLSQVVAPVVRCRTYFTRKSRDIAGKREIPSPDHKVNLPVTQFSRWRVIGRCIVISYPVFLSP